MDKPITRGEPEYLLIESGRHIRFIERKVWEHPTFRSLINGKLIGEGMTFDEAIAMKQLIESSRGIDD
jgi:hypothetical protein